MQDQQVTGKCPTAKDRLARSERHSYLMAARLWYTANRAAAEGAGLRLPNINDVQLRYNLTRWEALFVAGHNLVVWWP